MTRAAKTADPTSEETSEMSTQSAGGLTGGQPAPDADRVRAREENADPVRRTREERDDTPRRYEGENEPAIPADDANPPEM